MFLLTSDTNWNPLALLTNLTTLFLWDNRLTSLTLPEGLTNLTTLALSGNQLTSLTLPEGLTNLTTLVLYGNQLTSLTLPKGLTSLTALFLSDNQLTSLTFPEGLTALSYLSVTGNPLTRLLFPEGFNLNLLTIDGFNRGTATLYSILAKWVPGAVVISWPRDNGVLQSTDTVGGVWTDVQGATSPYQTDLSAAHRYFRVKPE